MAQFIGSSMKRGFAGAITRGTFDNTVETLRKGDTTAFGVLVKNVAGVANKVAAAGDDVYGITVRQYGQADTSGEAENLAVIAVLRRGYISVAVAGTPAIGGQVYRTAAGAFTAVATGNTAIEGCTFASEVDADGLAEIAYNI